MFFPFLHEMMVGMGPNALAVGWVAVAVASGVGGSFPVVWSCWLHRTGVALHRWVWLCTDQWLGVALSGLHACCDLEDREQRGAACGAW